MGGRLRCVRCGCGACGPSRVRRGLRGEWGRGLVALALGLALAGCAESDRGRGQVYDARADTERAQARATEIANDRQAELNRLEVTSRQTAAAAELGARLATLESERKSAEALGKAQVRELEATGEAKALAIRMAGYAGAVVLGAVALGVLILASGWTLATTRQAWASSQMVRIGVEPATMLPPPLVVTADGWLIDTRSGERARIRDAAGVQELKLKAMAEITQTALAGRAAAEVAKATGRPEDGAGLLLSRPRQNHREA